MKMGPPQSAIPCITTNNSAKEGLLLMARCGLNVQRWTTTGFGLAGIKRDAVAQANTMAETIGEALADQWANQTCPPDRPCRIRVPKQPGYQSVAQDLGRGGEWQIVPGLWLAVRQVQTIAFFWCLKSKDEPRTFPRGFEATKSKTRRKKSQ